MGRAPCCDKANVKKGPWSPEEDSKLKDYIDKHGTGGNWISLPQKAGLKRCGKSCRLRWLNYLRPNIKHGEFSQDEDRIICSLFTTIGSRWSIIAAQLPGRTDNDVKNYWNTKLKKKLMGAVSFSNKRVSLHHHDQFPNPTLPYPPLFQTLSNYPFATYNSPITTTGFDHHHHHHQQQQQQPISVQSNPFHGSYVGEEIKGPFLAFGGETSCSSSDGSSSNIQISSSHHEHDPFMGLSFQDYQVLNGGNICEGLLYPVEKSDDHNHDLLINYGDQKEQTEGYSSLEEIKQLISTNLCNNNSSSSSFVGQIKTEEELMYYY